MCSCVCVLLFVCVVVVYVCCCCDADQVSDEPNHLSRAETAETKEDIPQTQRYVMSSTVKNLESFLSMSNYVILL